MEEGFAGCDALDGDILGSAFFSDTGPLEAELSFRVTVGLDGSGFFVAAEVVATAGFFATADGGRLTSVGRKEEKIRLTSFFIAVKHYWVHFRS